MNDRAQEFVSSFRARTGHAPRVGLLCLSAIADDPRVRRQGDLFMAAGWDVFAVGLPGARSPAPDWPIAIADETNTSHVLRDLPMHVRTKATREALKAMRRRPADALQAAGSLAAQDPAAFLWLTGRIGQGLLQRIRRSVDGPLCAVFPRLAEGVYWRLNAHFGQLLEAGRAHQADLWLGSDWTSLPIVARLARERNATYAYDAHELAVDEYAQSARWRLVHRPVVRAIERTGATGAAFVTCVSEGIADRLQETHALSARPTVVRNMPSYQEMPLRPTGHPIRALYHGVVSPGRGLEVAIEAMTLLPRNHMTLTIRGPVSASYRAQLEGLVRDMGVVDRVRIEEPVPMVELVERANAFDIGLFVLPSHSGQNIHVLPNKFFEYTMAGLALCVSDLPEMTRFIREHGLGATIGEAEPGAVAAALMQLDGPAINSAKQASLNAARVLCWDNEGDSILALAEAALERKLS